MAGDSSVYSKHHELSWAHHHRSVPSLFGHAQSYSPGTSQGIIADFTKGKLGLPRSFCIVLVATTFIISQATCYSIVDIEHLWKASALLGLAYGGLFGLFPTLVIEWFGLGASHPSSPPHRSSRTPC